MNSTFSPLHYNILYQTAFFASICDPMLHVAAVSGSLQGVTVTYTQYAGSCCLLCKTFHVHFCPHKIQTAPCQLSGSAIPGKGNAEGMTKIH